jgi:hypothetical protein
MHYHPKITGSVLYYSRAVDPKVFMPLNDIGAEQTTAAKKNKKRGRPNIGLSGHAP